MNSIISPIIESIKPKRGIGAVVLLSWFLFTAWLALLLVMKRLSNIKLSHVAKVNLFGRFSFGSAAFWGVAIGIMGVGLLSVYFTLDEPDQSDRVLLWAGAVPLILTAFMLFVLQTVHNQLPTKIDILLKQAWLNKKVELAKIVAKPGVNVTKIDISTLMAEFEKYQVLQFYTDDSGNYIITSFNPIVERYFLDHPISSEAAGSDSWICKGCGAVNRMQKCEYCGNAAPLKV